MSSEARFTAAVPTPGADAFLQGYPALAGVPGQQDACALLASALAQDRVTHAYLFVGAPGALIDETAVAFAQALLCDQDGCGQCETCKAVARGTYPDCVVVSPEGARAYLVDQIRDVVVQTQYAPVRGSHKVFIIRDADRMNAASANAFLKTLEEPPAGVVFILIAPRQAAVLPTILSRCQVIRFRTIPASEAADIVQARTGVGHDQALLAVAACEGSVTGAIAFAGNGNSWELRSQVFAALDALRTADSWGAISAGRAIGSQWSAAADALKAEQDNRRKTEQEFLDKQALKAADARNKRELTAAKAAGFTRITALVRSWLRDVLLVREGMVADVANTDVRAALERAAVAASEQGIRQAIAATSRAEQLIAYNVQVQNVLDALVLALRAELYGY